MRSSQLLWAAPALSAAFLLPPNMNPDTDIAGLAAPLDLAINDLSISRVVRLSCDGCPYKEEGVETDLVFDFNLDAADPTKLMLNGLPVLPVNPMNPAIALKAAQLPKNTNTKDYFENRDSYENVELDYSLMTSTALILSNGGYKHDTLELRIAAVSGQPVMIPGVRMGMKEDLKDGHLMFDETTLLTPGPEACRGLTCLFKSILGHIPGTQANKDNKHRKPCHKGKPKPKQHGNPVIEGLKGLEESEKPHKGHGHHKHHGRRPSLFTRICKQIIFPISVGILAGLAVSAVGLIAGHIMVRTYHKVRGTKCTRTCGKGGRRGFWGRRRRERMERERLANEQAKGLLSGDEESAPAEAEAPPAYVDEGLEVVEKE